jgi:hypothetical protein
VQEESDSHRRAWHRESDTARYAASILDNPGHVEIAALAIELERFERDVQAKLMPINEKSRASSDYVSRRPGVFRAGVP